MKHFAIFIAEGFEETEAIATIDLLRRAGIKVTTISMQDSLEVISAHNIKVTADKSFASLDASTLDGIILPGGIPGVPNLKKSNELLSLIKTFHKGGLLVCAICAAPSILAELDILSGKDATVYPSFEVEDKGVNFTGKSVEVADNIITGKGLGVVFDFSLAIISKVLGEDKAKEIAAAIQMP